MRWRPPSKTFNSGEHLLVQAGTGTGKSLGYLAPALAMLAADPESWSSTTTATLALQAQLATKDIPAAGCGGEQVTGKAVRHAVLKGRSNYACLLRVREGTGTEQEALVADPTTASGVGAGGSSRCVRVGGGGGILRRRRRPRRRPATHAAGLGPDLDPRPRVPRRPEVPAGAECLAEKSRQVARGAQLVVTNHALLAIDALHGGTALPSTTAIVDEAHELAGGAGDRSRVGRAQPVPGRAGRCCAGVA